MVGPVDLVGLKVNFTSPANLDTGVNEHSKVSITFNSELNPQTVINGVYLLEDTRRIVDLSTGKIDISNFNRVECTVTYSDRVVTLKSVSQFKKDLRYVIYVPKHSVRDFKGREMQGDFISFFDTGLLESDEPCDVIYPENNSIIDKLTKVELSDIKASAFIVQISTNKDFNVGLYEKVVYHNKFEDDFGIKDGSYFIRSKGTNGDFGQTSFFTINSFRGAMVNESDYETFQYEEYVDDSLKEVSNFPAEEINVTSKLNMFYKEYNQLIEIDDIDFSESGVFHKHLTELDYDIEPLDGTFLIIQDLDEDVTHVSFVLDPL